MAGSRDVSVIIKTWLFPSIVTLLGTLIWRDMQEMRNDVKALLAQSNVDKTRIDNLERQVNLLNEKVLLSNSKTASYIIPVDDDGDKKTAFYVINKDMAITNSDRKKKALANLKRKTNDLAI